MVPRTCWLCLSTGHLSTVSGGRLSEDPHARPPAGSFLLFLELTRQPCLWALHCPAGLPIIRVKLPTPPVVPLIGLVLKSQ